MRFHVPNNELELYQEDREQAKEEERKKKKEAKKAAGEEEKKADDSQAYPLTDPYMSTAAAYGGFTTISWFTKI